MCNVQEDHIFISVHVMYRMKGALLMIFLTWKKKIKEKKVGFAVQSFDPLQHKSWGLTTIEKTGFENNVGKREKMLVY